VNPAVMPTRILVVGGGAREHALAWKLSAEPGVNLVVVAPGSDAIGELPRVRCVPVAMTDHAGIVNVARANAVELAVIGPEQPLAEGLADALRAAAVPTFGPSAAAARIESSKAFCHEIAAAAGVRMAEVSVCRSVGEAVAAVGAFAASGRGFVIKEDGLAAGKGVSVHGPEDVGAIEPDLERLFAAGSDRVVLVEERLEGPEASVIAIADGRDLVALPAARDHKRLGDRDTGPNTGGMGAYSPLADVPGSLLEEILREVHRPIVAEMAKRGTPFIGALYAGIMLTARGPVLLECNARFGDPETQVILPRLAVALGPLLLAASRGTLGSVAPGWSSAIIPVIPGAAVGIVIAGGAYPAASSTGDRIDGLAAAADRGGLVFHAGTRRPDRDYETNGGRILTVIGRGPNLAEARRAAEYAADAISFEGAQRRHDIAAGPVGEPVGAGR
jgi:phosphoribosylamine---glycine ligase